MSDTHPPAHTKKKTLLWVVPFVIVLAVLGGLLLLKTSDRLAPLFYVLH